MAIVYLGVGWFLGIWLGSTLELGLIGWLIIAGAGLLGAFLRSIHPTYRLALAILAAICLGGARYSASVEAIDPSHVAYYNDGDPVILTGIVVEEPYVHDRYVDLRLQVESLTINGRAALPVSGRVLVRTPRFPLIAYGARLELAGQLESPPELGEFDYRAYLARQGIQSMMVFPQLTVMAEGQGNPLKQALLGLKSKARAVVYRLIPDPQASLLSGILLGDDSGIAPGLKESFRVTGMTHIIAISGFNIAILIAAMTYASEPVVGRRGAVLVAGFGVALYTVLVGADASVVRAAIMGGIYLLSERLLGRSSFAVAVLVLAGFLMTLLDPQQLWDVGFQLSFAATLGLILFAEPLADWAREWLLRIMDEGLANRIMSLLTGAVIATLAAQILVLPLIVAYFGQLSLISPLANALVLPAQPAVMLWGGLATLTGMFAPAVGQIFAWVAWLFLGYTTGLVRLFAGLPGAAVPVKVSTATVILAYLAIAGFTWLWRQESEKRSRLLQGLHAKSAGPRALGVSILALLLVIAWAATQPDGRLHVAFLDVGQGDAIFIQTPSGRQILVDGGLYPTVINDELGRQMPFWDQQIDIVVATHPDADHVSGLPGVFERYQVDRLITNGAGMGESAVYDEMLLAAEADGSDIHKAVAGETITIGDGVQLEILHPGDDLVRENQNDNSVCLRLVYGNFSLLLTGDAEEWAERQMVASGRLLQAVVFKAGHHGSRSSSNDFFLEVVRPEIVVISAGADNRFGHPHPEVLERAAAVGAAVLRTDELGTIEVISDGRSMWWEGE